MRRRQAFSEGRPARVVLRDPPGCELHILPLLAGDEAVGVIEVVAPASRMAERRDAIEATVQQSALLIRAATDRAEVTRAMRAMGSLFDLTARLMSVDTPLEALRLGVDLCGEELEVPVAGVRPDRAEDGWYLAGVAGVGARRRAALREAARHVSVHGPRTSVEREIACTFAREVGWERAEVVPAGEGLLLVAGRSNGSKDFLTAVGSLVGEAMSHAGDLRTARSQIEGLDLGIAWTAHELRGPLIGASAALDHVLTSMDGADQNELLLRTRGELDRLSELVDPLLRWSAGAQALDRRRVDLVEVARDAIETCRLEYPNHPIAFDASHPVAVRADPEQLSGAVANVLRNALAYSPVDEPVRVTIRRRMGVASVCVADHGPGVAPEEREFIFDPFARGSAGRRVRIGHGLGLFIARRIAQAHGGKLRLLPSTEGATFCLQLAIASERGQASAS